MGSKPDLDLVVSQGNGDEIYVLLNNGSGAFSPTGTFDSSLGQPGNVMVADLDDDQLDDVIVFGVSGDEFGIYWNQGNGELLEYTIIEVTDFDTYRTGDIAVGDLNGDSLTDLVFEQNGQTVFMAGNGDIVGLLLLPDDGQPDTDQPYIVAYAPECVCDEFDFV